MLKLRHPPPPSRKKSSDLILLLPWVKPDEEPEGNSIPWCHEWRSDSDRTVQGAMQKPPGQPLTRADDSQSLSPRTGLGNVQGDQQKDGPEWPRGEHSQGQFSSVAQSCLTLCDPMDCSTPGFSILHYLLEFAQSHVIESMMPSNHLILCHHLFLLPSMFPSIRVFCSELALPIRWSKYWSFSFSISPSNEFSGLISLRIDCFDILAVQGTLKSLLQHHSSKA